MTLLTDLWADSTGHKCILAIKDGAVKPLFVRDAAQAEKAATLLDAQQWDVYFAPAVFESARRVAAQAQGISSFFIDLDCGADKPYKKWLHALVGLLRWCKTHNFWRPSYIVRSGGGLHVYWLLDAGYPRDAWLPAAQHLKQALAVGNVYADAACTADAARVLRVPGTHNWKNPDRPLPVRTLFGDGRRLSLDEFVARLPQVGPLRGVPSGPKPSSEWDVADEYPPGDALGIAGACAQMGEVHKKAGAVAEPFWRASLSVLQRCDNAEQHIEAFSKGDPRYNRQEALEKARRTGGPATCAYFNDVNPGGCAGCPHAGKVTSPIQLALASAGADPTAKDKPDRLTRLGQFQLTDAGVYYQAPAPEGQAPEPPTRFCTVPVWLEEVREQAHTASDRGNSSLLVHWVSVDRRHRKALLLQRDLYEPKALRAWLADHNIMAAVMEMKLMVAYISQYSLALLKKQGAKEYHETLGWYENGFVLGNRMVTKDGTKDALVQSNNPIGRIEPKGDVAEWVRAVEVFNQTEYWPHAFAVLCGFASPLLHLCGYQSAVVSLVGPSGAGKTLAAHAALSIYSDYQHLTLGASSTTNAWEKQMECNRHVPFLLDEVTQFATKKLTEFIYTAANGQAKSTLTRNRDNRRVVNWQLVPFITSNHPVLELDQRDVEEAHRRRMLEVSFPGAMDGVDGGRVDTGIRDNYGVAGEVYLQYVCRIREHIPQLMEAALRHVRAQGLPDANRFGAWTLAAAMVGGQIAKELGLIRYDVNRVCNKVAKMLGGQAEATLLDADRAQNAILEWLTANSKRICFWREGSVGMNAGQPVDDPICRVVGGAVFVHRSRMNEMLREERLSVSQLKPWLERIQMAPPARVRLAPGTPPVPAYRLKTELLGFDEDEIKEAATE